MAASFFVNGQELAAMGRSYKGGHSRRVYFLLLRLWAAMERATSSSAPCWRVLSTR